MQPNTEKDSAPAVRLENIGKSFGSVRANKNISLDLHAGRIKALLGENGAGKSTLMSILAGKLQPDSGKIFIDGAEKAILFESGLQEYPPSPPGVAVSWLGSPSRTPAR